jgi:hypothetical protein
MFETLRKLRQLSPAERETIASGRFAGDYTPDALLDQMRTLARFDASNDATRGSLKKWIWSIVLLTFFGLIALKFVPHSDTFLRAFWILPLLGVELVLVIAMGVTLRRLRNVDIGNNFRQVALPFLSILKQDLDPNQTVTVRIDLRDPLHDSKRKKTGTPYAEGAYHKIVDTTYMDPWFHGKTVLADGSRLVWTVYDTIIKSTRTKKTASRKIKTKTRHVKRSQVAIALSVPNKVYGVKRGAAPENGKLAVAGGAKRSTIKLVRKLKTQSLDPIDPALLVDAVSGAYRQITAPARSAA